MLILTNLFIMVKDYRLRMEDYEILKPEPNDPTALVRPIVILGKWIGGFPSLVVPFVYPQGLPPGLDLKLLKAKNTGRFKMPGADSAQTTGRSE